jgi:hypothetical protein
MLLWLANSTSICRRIATICSALCFFRAMPQLLLASFSNIFPSTKFAGHIISVNLSMSTFQWVGVPQEAVQGRARGL